MSKNKLIPNVSVVVDGKEMIEQTYNRVSLEMHAMSNKLWAEKVSGCIQAINKVELTIKRGDIPMDAKAHYFKRLVAEFYATPSNVLAVRTVQMSEQIDEILYTFNEIRLAAPLFESAQ